MCSKIKCVIVGDGYVGRLSLATVYVTDVFPESLPTVGETFSKTLTVDGVKVTLAIHLTAGQEDFDRSRPLSYPETDVFVICYAIDSRPSFEHVDCKWVREVKRHCPEAQIVLAATKVDLRNDSSTLERLSAKNGGAPISTSEGLALAEKIGASKFVECSALTRVNVDAVFEEAVRAAWNPVKPKPKTCKIL